MTQAVDVLLLENHDGPAYSLAPDCQEVTPSSDVLRVVREMTEDEFAEVTYESR